MKTVKRLQLLGLAVILVLVSACQSKPKDGLTDTYTSGVIAIAADESFQPIVQEEVDVFEGIFPLAGIVPPLCDGSRSRQSIAQGQSTVGNHQPQTDTGGDELFQQPEVLPAGDKDCYGWVSADYQ